MSAPRPNAERRIGRALRQAPVPVDPGAEERGLELVLAAHYERSSAPTPRPTSGRRLATALAFAALLGAVLLSPAGAKVRGWVGDAFDGSAPPPRPSPGLARIPGGGRLLVQSGAGPWVLSADGSRRRLGRFDEASWSPHGLYVAAAIDDTLRAVAPDGSVHWSLRAPGRVRDPRWAPSGELVAYRAGSGLRVVAGDGSEDRPLDDSVAPVAPSWSPDPERTLLAYVDARGALRILDAASGAAPATAAALTGIDTLEWGGRALLEASPRRLRLRHVGAAGTVASLGRPVQVGLLGAHPIPGGFALPPGQRFLDVALSPDGSHAAAVIGGRFEGAERSDLLVIDLRDGGSVRLLSVPGRLGEVLWAPGGERLLTAWPRLDEWLFLPAHLAPGRALNGVARAFATPAGAVAFPTVSGWCCRPNGTSGAR